MPPALVTWSLKYWTTRETPTRHCTLRKPTRRPRHREMRAFFSCIPGWGRSPGEGNGYPLQYSSLENSVNRGAWWATRDRVAQSWTRLSTHPRTSPALPQAQRHAHLPPAQGVTLWNLVFDICLHRNVKETTLIDAQNIDTLLGR